MATLQSTVENPSIPDESIAIRTGILPRGTRRSRSRSAASFRFWGGREPWLIFTIGLVVYAALGWYGAYALEIYNMDGLARIAQAHGVLLSRDPHLGALGLVWPPLPALTNIPLVAFLKPLGAAMLAGPLMSAFYTALALSMLSGVLKKFGLDTGWRLAWVALFGIQKLIVHNATMGLSEAGFLAFLLLSLNGYMSWDKEKKVSGLVAGGVGSALAIYCRYEGLAWAAVMMAAIIWRLSVSGHRPWEHIVEGTLLAFAVPIGWATPLWMALNWQLKGNPLFFLVGTGATSNTPDTAKAVGQSHEFFYAYGSVSGSASLLLKQILEMAPLLLAASVILVLLVFWRKRWSDLAYLALSWSILGFTFLSAFLGVLPVFSRYFFWAVPGAFIAAGAAFSLAHNAWSRRLVAALTVILALYSGLMMPLDALSKLPPGQEQSIATAFLVAPDATGYTVAGVQMDEFQTMAGHLNSQTPGTLTLLDASVGSPVVFYLDRPQDMVMTTDRDFFQILRAPKEQVDQILVPFPSFDAMGRSEVLRMYPDLYEQGTSWARLVQEFPGPMRWRLYRVEEQVQ